MEFALPDISLYEYGYVLCMLIIISIISQLLSKFIIKTIIILIKYDMVKEGLTTFLVIYFTKECRILEDIFIKPRLAKMYLNSYCLF